MKITITVEVERTGTKKDICIENTQKMTDTVKVLRDNLPEYHELGNITGLREKEMGRWLDIEKTFEEEAIYSGTELVIYDERGNIE